MYQVVNVYSLKTVFTGKTYKEVAEYLGVNEHTVKTKYYQSLCCGDYCVVKNKRDLNIVLENEVLRKRG